MANGGGNDPRISVSVVMEARGYARAMAIIRRENDQTITSLNRLTRAFEQANRAGNSFGGMTPPRWGNFGGGGGPGGRRRPQGGAGPAGWPQTAGGGGQNYQRGGITRGGAIGPLGYDLGSLIIGRGRMTDVNRFLNILQRIPPQFRLIGSAAFAAAAALGQFARASNEANNAAAALTSNPMMPGAYMSQLEPAARNLVAGQDLESRAPLPEVSWWRRWRARMGSGGGLYGLWTGRTIGGEDAEANFRENLRQERMRQGGPLVRVKNEQDILDQHAHLEAEEARKSRERLNFNLNYERSRRSNFEAWEQKRRDQEEEQNNAYQRMFKLQMSVEQEEKNFTRQQVRRNIVALQRQRAITPGLGLVERGSDRDVEMEARQQRAEGEKLDQKLLDEQARTSGFAEQIVTEIQKIAPAYWVVF